MAQDLPLRIGAAASWGRPAARAAGTSLPAPAGAHAGRKEVAVPIGSVIKIGTLLIRLSLTKHQAKDLPLADIDRPAG
jgi:hypothetical protein